MKYQPADFSQGPVQGQVTLERSATTHRILGSLMALLGAPLSLVALAALSSEKPDFGSHLLGGLGVSFLGFGLLMLFFWKIPRRFIFDNTRGVLLVEADDKDGNLAQFALPYQEIEGFATQGGTQRVENTRSSTFHTKLYKRDGAAWTLNQESDFNQANRLTQYLNEHVDLSVHCDDPPRLPLDEFTVDAQQDKISVRWSLRRPFKRSLIMLWTLSGFGLIARGLYFNEPGIPSWIGIIFIVLFLASYLYALVASFFAKQVVDITENHLHVYTRGGLPLQKDFSMPVEEVDAILFHFNPNESGNAQLMLLDASQRDIFERMKSEDVGKDDFVHLLSAMWNTKKVPIEALSFGGRMALEQRLQELIETHTGHLPE